jgi:hypothetical protein
MKRFRQPPAELIGNVTPSKANAGFLRGRRLFSSGRNSKHVARANCPATPMAFEDLRAF